MKKQKYKKNSERADCQIDQIWVGTGLVATFADFANKKAEGRIYHEIKFFNEQYDLSRKCEMQMRADGYSYYLDKTKYLKKNVPNLLE